jgi:hypothetical protein
MMKKLYLIQMCFAFTSIFCGQLYGQTKITEWTFEENPLLPNEINPAPTFGSGSASVVGSMTTLSRSTGSSTGCSQTTGTGSWAFGNANPGTNESSGAQFMVSTSGYQNIRFTYDQRMSNTATRTERIQYTLDGLNWINFNVDASNSTITCNGSYDNGRFDRGNTVGQNMSDSWSRKSVDFSSISAANNNPNFGVRIVAAHFGSTGEFRQANNSTSIATGGTWRFDNVRFTASPANISIAAASNFVVYDENVGTIQVPVTVANANASPIELSFGLAVYSTATPNEDFTWTNTLIIPASSNGIFNLPISIIDDALAERTETIIVKILSGENAAISTNNYYQIIYIKDNDYQAPVATNELKMNLLTSFSNGAIGANSAEIVVHDPSTQRLYIANSIGGKLDIVNFANPSNPSLFASIDVSLFGGINSVVVHNGLVACAMENTNPQMNGSVVFFNADGVFINEVEVGPMPDMITFNKDFTKLLTANEGEPNADYSVDPEGSISVIDLSNGVENLTNADVTNISLDIFNGQEAALLAQGIRIFSTSASVAQDLEPEYIIVSDDNQTAFVALQENNAIIIIDLNTNSIQSIHALGYSDYSNGNGMDASDQTGQILITSLPVKGAYMPDAMAFSTINGQGYVFTANEGDSREFGSVVDAARISTLSLDPTVFPDQAILKNNRFAGRLNGLRYSGDLDGDGDLDEIHVLGARSFSIWDATTAELVFDSKDLIEQIIAAHPTFSSIFNASNTAATPVLKNRSDDKGPEPEGIVTAKINGSTYAFVSLERIGGAMIFNVDDPTSPVYVGYENNRSLTGIGPDLGAEGMIFISAEDSPNGNSLLILANEVSSTLSIYQINTCAELSNIHPSALEPSLCEGESTIISFNTNAATTTKWIVNDQIIDNETDNELEVDAAGLYSVIVVNSALACSGKSNTVQIIVNALPELEIIASSEAICLGEEVTLTAQGADFFNWDNSVENNVSFIPEETKTYTVTGTNESGCSSQLDITVEVYPKPIFSLGDDVTVCVYNLPVVLTAPSGFVNYTWTGNVSGASLTVNEAGTYACTVSNSFGCETTESIQVFVSECLGLNENDAKLFVYPNPFETKVIVTSNLMTGEILILDMNGSVVVKETISSSQTELDLSSLASGVYMMQASNGSELFRTRIVKK